MKIKLYLFLLLLCISAVVQAQTTKIVDVTAGNLYASLTETELITITDLTITGSIDARDFNTMRDNMPLLAKVDISGAIIVAYMNYPANEIPQAAFYKYTETSNLTSIIFPPSLTAIGRNAFLYCGRLTEILIPSMVTTIREAAFSNCSSLKSVFIPVSVLTIESSCFAFCPELTSITIESSVPPSLNAMADVFYQVDKGVCVLKVPYQSAGAYRNAYQWGYFQNILEATNGFNVSSNKVTINGTVGSTATANINSNMEWTANSDQDWLVVNPTSGNGLSQPITFTAEANPSFVNTRTAYVTIAAPGMTSQKIAVTQSVHPQSPKTWEATPGGLANAFTAEELATIYDLTLTGTIDARDFKTMRDKMPLLSKINLIGATIVAYNGTEGTTSNVNAAYPENTVPENAFAIKVPYVKENVTLTNIVLPESLTAIGQFSFFYCTALQDVTIPTSVTTIDTYAFNGCSSMKNITIPSSVENIGVRAFGQLIAVINVDPNNANYLISEGVLFNKDQTQLIQCSVSKSGSYTLPSTVTTVGEFAFFDCRQLTSIIIPSSVVAIGNYAFASCFGLNSLIVHSTVPVNFEPTDYVFSPSSDCTLYVPIGSKMAYQTANQWENFQNIMEVNPDLIAEAGPNQQIDERTLVTLNGSVKLNISGRPVSYQWKAPEGITLSSDTVANPTFTAPEIPNGSGFTMFTLSLTISDGVNYSTADEVYIVVGNVNRPPVANAGNDQTVNEKSLVTLDGSASFDPDDNYLSYVWTSPNGIYINSRNSSKATFTAPEVNADTKFTFYLTVQETFSYQTDTIVITVKNINQVPTANAGNMQIVNEGETVTLDARSSRDPDGDILTYKWTAPEGITLSSTTSATPSFTVSAVESDTWLNFTLVVNDGKVNSPTAQVNVLVRNVPSILTLLAKMNNMVSGVHVKYQLFMYDGNDFIHKRDTFAVTGDTLRLLIEPGYWIGLVSPARDPSAFIPTYSGNVLSWGEAEVIKIPENGVAYMDITCPLSPVAKTGVGQIAGYVYEKPGNGTQSISIARKENLATSNPVETALVQLYKKGSAIPVTSVFTDNQGAYKFEKLEIADYEIKVDMPGYAQSEKYPVTLSDIAPATMIWFAVNTSTKVITDNNAIQISMVKAYPNPTPGIVHITGLPGKTEIAVYTLEGKLILKKETSLPDETVDITNQASGTYIFVINEQRLKIYKK